ncbi:MAG TPA: phospholipase A [Sedimentisphaerales bacterium]|nr:phospholipase A [Sedimentisphaerales bacterium]
MARYLQEMPHLMLTCLLIILLSATAAADQLGTSFQTIHSGPGLSLHKEMFMLPVTWSNEYNGRMTETVFQVSAKHRLFNTRLYFAYTQISFWQAYDHNNSAPFRETNYNPELFYRTSLFNFRPEYIGADIGFEHESNGQKPPTSRSWNLIYFSPYYHQANWLIYMKLRYRIPEKDKEFPGAAVGDDNPDITDFLGYSDLHVQYRTRHGHSMHVTLRGNARTKKGGVSLIYTIPVPTSERSSLGFRVSHGYGESLVDYNKSLTRVGVGVFFDR